MRPLRYERRMRDKGRHAEGQGPAPRLGHGGVRDTPVLLRDVRPAQDGDRQVLQLHHQAFGEVYEIRVDRCGLGQQRLDNEGPRESLSDPVQVHELP